MRLSTQQTRRAALYLGVLLALSIGVFPTSARAQGTKNRRAGSRTGTRVAAATVATKSDDELKAELAEILPLPAAERVSRLELLLKSAAPGSPVGARVAEHLVSAHAALGDERLQAGDAAGGVREMRQAFAAAPAAMSDKLFLDVVVQLPANLFVRGQREASFALARSIEARVKDSAPRLLALTAFYLRVEAADEAARVAALAAALAPEDAAPHVALGTAYRIALRLDEAAAEYARAFALDPQSRPARRNLADLRRATGKSDEALALDRAQLGIEPADAAARTGVVLALLETNQRAEAERELAAARAADARNLPLLVGAAYWFAAHGEGARALELAGRAVKLEPRYTWAQIAFARALILQQQPLEAERALRFARQYGQFPTLDYELANALAAAGLYEEAADELARAFTLDGDQLSTQLAGRVGARADNFLELLAPERRASIFQFAPADTEVNARTLKSLLALRLALGRADAATTATGNVAVDEARALAAAQAFAAGTDPMRAFRQLYAANRLLRRGVAPDAVRELAEASKSGIASAIDTPAATNAALADELFETRMRAIAAGATPDIPDVPRATLAAILRGRADELAGWSLFNQGRVPEAVIALRRAAEVLPPSSLYWRSAMWRLGSALSADGQPRDALAAYLKSYNPQSPDPARRAVIEALYRKLNGSLDGLEPQLDPAAALATKSDSNSTDVTAATAPVTNSTPAAATTPAPAATPEPAPVAVPESTPVVAVPSETAPAAVMPEVIASESANASPAPTKPEPTPEAMMPSAPAAVHAATPDATTPAAEPSTPVVAEPTAPVAATKRRSGRHRTTIAANAAAPSSRRAADNCTLALSADALTIKQGETSSIIATVANQASASEVSATTANWADILVVQERAPVADNPAAVRFVITSINKQPGTFNVTFKSACGGVTTLAVTVN